MACCSIVDLNGLAPRLWVGTLVESQMISPKVCKVDRASAYQQAEAGMH